MKTYSDYAFYVETYGGIELSEDSYRKAARNATQYIKYVTLGRSERCTCEELKYAMCAVVEAYVSVYGLAGRDSSIGQIKSENTDGYSVSYVTQAKDGESLEDLFRRKAYPLVKQWLGDTGLLNRKVGCCHVD